VQEDRVRYALITGGLGFIGSHIAKNLLNKELVDRVVLVDHYGNSGSLASMRLLSRRAVRKTTESLPGQLEAINLFAGTETLKRQRSHDLWLNRPARPNRTAGHTGMPG
jgi:nucleoside-diphosphate-sugar epimerase